MHMTTSKKEGDSSVTKGEVAAELSSMNSTLTFVSINSGLIVQNFTHFPTFF